MSKLIHRLINSQTEGYVLAIITMLIWGGFSLLSRLSMHWGIVVWDILALRFALASLIIAPFLIHRRHWRFLFTRQSALLAFFGGVCYCVTVYSAYYLAPVAHGIILLNGLFPIITALFAWLILKQRFDEHTKISIGIISTVFVIMFVIMLLQGEKLGFGDALFVLSALFFAGFSTLLKIFKFSALEVMASLSIWSAIMYLPFYALFATPQFYHVTPIHLATQAIFHALFVVVIATLTYARAIEKLGLITAGTIANIAPFLAAVVAVPLLHEPLNGMMIFGLIGMAIGALQPWRLLKNWRLLKK